MLQFHGKNLNSWLNAKQYTCWYTAILFSYLQKLPNGNNLKSIKLRGVESNVSDGPVGFYNWNSVIIHVCWIIYNTKLSFQRLKRGMNEHPVGRSF